MTDYTEPRNFARFQYEYHRLRCLDEEATQLEREWSAAYVIEYERDNPQWIVAPLTPTLLSLMNANGTLSLSRASMDEPTSPTGG